MPLVFLQTLSCVFIRTRGHQKFLLFYQGNQRIGEIFAGAVAQPVLLCTPTLRPHIWRLFARVLPHLGVLSHNEVPPQVHVASIATLD